MMATEATGWFVARREGAASDNARRRRLEEARADLHRDAGYLVGRLWRSALDDAVRRRGSAAQQSEIREERSGTDARNRVERGQDLSRHRCRDGPIVDRDEHQRLAIEAGIETAEIVQGSYEKAGDDEERHAQRHLRGDQHAVGAGPMPRRTLPVAAGGELRFESHRRPERRQNPDDDGAPEGDADDEEERSRVRRGMEPGRDIGRRVAQQDAQRERDQRKPGRRRDPGQENVLGHQLANDARPPAPEREPYRELATPGRGARQQERADVRRSDEEHREDACHEDVERLGKSRPGRVSNPGRTRPHGEARREEPAAPHLGPIGVPGRLLRGEARVHDGRFGAGVRNVDAGFEPGEHGDVPRGEPLRGHALHIRDRPPQVGILVRLDPGEAARRDTDDGEREAAEHDHRPPNDRWITPKPPLPIGVAEHDGPLGVRLDIVHRREPATDRHAHAEQVEEIAGDPPAVNRFVGAGYRRRAGLERPRAARVREHPGERRCSRTQLIILMKRERARFTSAGVVPGERDQRGGIGHGKTPKQERVDDRKHRGVGADADRERQHRDRRERRAAPKETESEGKVGEHVVEPWHAPDVAAGFFDLSHVAKDAARLPPRLGWRHATRDQRVGLLLEVGADLVRESVETWRRRNRSQGLLMHPLPPARAPATRRSASARSVTPRPPGAWCRRG